MIANFRMELANPQVFLERLCSRDTTLWSSQETEQYEIAHRLDWLDAMFTQKATILHAEALLEELLSEGFSHAVVLGMGGSSLAPEVFSSIFNSSKKKLGERLELSIIDSTNPEQIREKREALPINRTLFIVSSKSGGTAEVNALEDYFWNEFELSGEEKIGNHFIAITDPGTTLYEKGKEKKYREVIEANPDVGGRYSALIEFGLVPAVLMGIDGKRLLKAAEILSLPCDDKSSEIQNPGLELGFFLAECYLAGKDKLTLVTDPELVSMGSWIEQLIAESSGKNGKGILPIDREPIYETSFYSDDRIFVYISLKNKKNDLIEQLSQTHHPTFTIVLDNFYDLGREYLRWEIATATVCSLIGVNAFDQPNVQLSKSITQKMIGDLKKNSDLPLQKKIFSSAEIEIFGEIDDTQKLASPELVIDKFLEKTKEGDFVALNAFITRNDQNFQVLQELRKRIAFKTNLATTVGFGPRYLHSTGQLHKGGKNNGHYLIITEEPQNDIEIPNQGLRFGDLLNAQAIGDMVALEQQERHTIRVHFKKGIKECKLF